VGGEPRVGVLSECHDLRARLPEDRFVSERQLGLNLLGCCKGRTLTLLTDTDTLCLPPTVAIREDPPRASSLANLDRHQEVLFLKLLPEKVADSTP
jgi:hypothetical protein